MRVSSKVECGIIALVDIAVNSWSENIESIVMVNAISQRNNISAKYLEQIIPLLKQAGLLRSIKGSGGGYTLSREPASISLNEIVNALDSSILAEALTKRGLPATAFADLTQGVAAARDYAAANGIPLIALGSLYMYREFTDALDRI